jgi:hypothetical protein
VVYWLEHRGLAATDGTVESIFAAAKSATRVLTEDEVRALVP